MTYEPLHHKYRPQTFAQLVGQSAIAATLTNAINQSKIAPAYLFTGARGTGKTSSARILAKSLNCLQSDRPTPDPCGTCEVCRMIALGQAMDVIEIDAASNTGVDNIRELIDRAQFAPVQCRYKVYVIDECHMLSTSAFNALLKTLEEPPDRVVFVLATTDPQRVLSTIISRCQKFDFRRIPLPDMVGHLQTIADKEAIDITPEALNLVAQIAQGGLRDAESLLDQLSLLPSQISITQVWDLVGAVPELDLLRLLEAIAVNDPETVLDQARRLMERGREPLTLLQNLTSFYRDLLIAKTAPQRQDLVAITPSTWAQLCIFAQNVDLPAILVAQQHLRSCELQVKNSTQPRLWLEVALLGLLPANLQPAQSLPALATPAPSVRPSSAPATPAAPTAVVAPASAATPTSQPVSPPPPASSQPPVPTPSLPTPPASAPVAAEAPAPRPPEPTPETDLDLTSLWQRVLQAMQPPSTRELLRQHARLLAYRGKEARVGISSQPLVKISQERLPNIEAAFEALMGHLVRVKLEVAPPPNPEPGAGAGRRNPTPNPPGQPPTAASAPADLAPPAARPIPPPAPTRSPLPTPPAEDLPPLEPPPPPAPVTGAKWHEVDDLTKAARSFAQFFNGVVVNLETGEPEAEESEAKPSVPGVAPEIDLVEPDPADDDMPF